MPTTKLAPNRSKQTRGFDHKLYKIQLVLKNLGSILSAILVLIVDITALIAYFVPHSVVHAASPNNISRSNASAQASIKSSPAIGQQPITANSHSNSHITLDTGHLGISPHQYSLPSNVLGSATANIQDFTSLQSLPYCDGKVDGGSLNTNWCTDSPSYITFTSDGTSTGNKAINMASDPDPSGINSEFFSPPSPASYGTNYNVAVNLSNLQGPISAVSCYVDQYDSGKSWQKGILMSLTPSVQGYACNFTPTYTKISYARIQLIIAGGTNASVTVDGLTWSVNND
jgi:hypothetical protein